jgi:hypothetical protein
MPILQTIMPILLPLFDWHLHWAFNANELAIKSQCMHLPVSSSLFFFFFFFWGKKSSIVDTQKKFKKIWKFLNFLV